MGDDTLWQEDILTQWRIELEKTVVLGKERLIKELERISHW